MNKHLFIDFLTKSSPKNSRKASSYAMAIRILDEIFLQKDVFGLNGTSLYDVQEADVLLKIRDFVKSEEKKMRDGDESIFVYGKKNQTSYPSKGFCSAAVLNMIDFTLNQQAHCLIHGVKSPRDISRKLNKLFDLTKKGTDEIVVTKQRVGQDYFREMILHNYGRKCCITGLNIPAVLQASHITSWSKDVANRMNPENGLCLSATYHEAFDAHLFSLDEDCRIILSNQIRNYLTIQVSRDYFEKFEGIKIALPVQFMPNQTLLAKHRELLAG